MGRRKKKYMIAIPLIFSYLLVLLGISLAQGGMDLKKNADYENKPEQAMLAFEHALRNHDIKGILTAFSRTIPWHYVSYEIGSGRRLSRKTITFAQMEMDFKARKGWWHFFVGGPEIRDPNYSDQFIRKVKYRKQGSTFFINSTPTNYYSVQ
jgi:hypothetical protein